MSAVVEAARSPRLARSWSVVVVAALGTAAFLLGLGIAAVSWLFGDLAPIVFLAVPLVPVLALWTLATPLVGALLVLATFPIGSVGTPVGPITVQAVEVAVIVVAMLVALHRLAVGLPPFRWTPALIWPIALLAWMLVSLYSALDEARALKVLVSLAGGIAFAATVVTACRDMVDVRRFMGAFTLVGTGIAVTALSGGGDFRSEFGGSAVVSGRLQGALDHPNQLGTLCALFAPVAASLVVGARTARARVASGVALSLILVALLLSLSRGAWLGTFLAFLFMLFTLRETRRLLAIASVPLVALLIGFAWVSPSTTETKVIGERARAFTERSPYDKRDAIYAEAVREILADPVTGQGPGSFPIASARAGSEATTVSAQHAHNLFLTWAAESGLPTAAIIAGFIVALGFAARRGRREALLRGDRQDVALVAGLSAALIAVLGQFMVDYTLGNSVVHIAVWSTIGALLACSHQAVRPARRRRKGRWRPQLG